MDIRRPAHMRTGKQGPRRTGAGGQGRPRLSPPGTKITDPEGHPNMTPYGQTRPRAARAGLHAGQSRRAAEHRQRPPTASANTPLRASAARPEPLSGAEGRDAARAFYWFASACKTVRLSREARALRSVPQHLANCCAMQSHDSVATPCDLSRTLLLFSLDALVRPRGNPSVAKQCDLIQNRPASPSFWALAAPTNRIALAPAQHQSLNT